MNIKELRLKSGLSQQELSEKTGIPKGRINNWEQGTGKPKADDYKTLRDFFEGNEIHLSHLKAIKGGGGPEPNEIPFYDAVAMGGMSLVAEQEAVYSPTEMINPGTWFRAATGSMRVYGHSMFPKYPAGCIVAFKEVLDRDLIQYGEDYVVETSEYRVIKRIQKCKKDDCIQLNSYNTQKDETGSMINAPFDVPISKVKRLFKVIGKVELETAGDIIHKV